MTLQLPSSANHSKITDYGIRQFLILLESNAQAKVIFNKENINLSNHNNLAESLVKNYTKNDLIFLLNEKSIQTNIKFQIIKLLSKKYNLTKEVIKDFFRSSSIISIHEYANTLVLKAKDSIGIQDLIIFNNWKIISWYFNSYDKDNYEIILKDQLSYSHLSQQQLIEEIKNKVDMELAGKNSKRVIKTRRYTLSWIKKN